ncbi:MAG: Hsp20 family protein [Bacteroidota bacterium]
MQTDQNLIKILASEALVQNVIGGGISETNVSVKPEDEGLRVEVKTPTLNSNAYDIEIRSNLLTIYTSFNKGVSSEIYHEGRAIEPTLIKTVLVPGVVDTDQIDAVFNDGVLNVFLPFKNKEDLAPKKISIRHF